MTPDCLRVLVGLSQDHARGWLFWCCSATHKSPTVQLPCLNTASVSGKILRCKCYLEVFFSHFFSEPNVEIIRTDTNYYKMVSLIKSASDVFWGQYKF